MKRFIYILSFLIALPVLSSCDNEDDLMGIFTAKTWILTDIMQGTTSYFIWNTESTEEEKEISKNLLRTEGNYEIAFSGSLVDGTISGTYKGKAVSGAGFSNVKWSANQKNDFHSEDFSYNDSDPLAIEFIYGLQHAHSYGGDYNNLYIYYDTPEGKKHALLFHVKK
ncbi:MAG: DUF4847 domain-containing protein [Bacteroides sp.]|nr:DUF4847 domain-containing protein [Bacteroides sp.]